MKKLSRISRLEFISFLTGFCLLTYELAAARVLAPVIGSSTYVWTSVIGVIIAALAFGFFMGGKVADARAKSSDLAVLLILAATAALISLLLYPTILSSIAASELDVRLLALYVATVLFAPTSLLIGMTSPYIAKLNVNSLKLTGQKIASIDALNSIGGIVGTFLTGFVLFGTIGSRQTLAIVIILLLASSWLVVPAWQRRRRIVMNLIVLLTVALSLPGTASLQASIDTPSARYEIAEGGIDGRSVRALLTGPTGAQSAIYTDGSDELVFWYAHEVMRLAKESRPESILVLGGGAFTLPEALGNEFPDAEVDVVEIDPELQTISERFFNYEQPPNVRHYFSDARTFVNQSEQRYDLIMVDVYGDTAIPFQLMTHEYGEAAAGLLTNDGLLIANVITALSGPCLDVTKAVVGSYNTSLPVQGYVTEDQNKADFDDARRANYIITFQSSGSQRPSGMRQLPRLDPVAYNDNFMPAERLHQQCRNS